MDGGWDLAAEASGQREEKRSSAPQPLDFLQGDGDGDGIAVHSHAAGIETMHEEVPKMYDHEKRRTSEDNLFSRK